MQLSPTTNHETAILARVVAPDEPTLSPAAAEAFLAMGFSPTDQERANALAAKARAGTLTTQEQAEVEAYSRINSLLTILQSKARQSLKGRRRTNGKPRSH